MHVALLLYLSSSTNKIIFNMPFNVYLTNLFTNFLIHFLIIYSTEYFIFSFVLNAIE